MLSEEEVQKKMTKKLKKAKKKATKYFVLWNICTLTVTVTTAQPALVLLARHSDTEVDKFTKDN